MPNVYQNRHDGRVIAFFKKESSEMRSLRLMKKKLRNVDIHWNRFLHLTYDDAHLPNACSNDIRVFFNRYKQLIRNRIKKLSKQRFLGPVLALIFKKGINALQYAWKVEFDSSGNRDYNPHFHVLLNSWYIPKSEIDRCWTFGSITWIQGIYSNRMAQKYVSKYFSKKSDGGTWKGRKWSTSRNVKMDKRKSDWKWLGFMGILESYLMVKFQLTDIKGIDLWIRYEHKHQGNVKRELKTSLRRIPQTLKKIRELVQRNTDFEYKIIALQNSTNSKLPLNAAVLDCLVDCSCNVLPLIKSPESTLPELNNYDKLPIQSQMLRDLNLHGPLKELLPGRNGPEQ
jgi:hypothetical protein